MFEHLTGYPGIFFLCLFAGIGVPLPEDIAVALAGVLVATGEVNWLPALALAWLGVLGRDSIVWCLGRFFGDWALRRKWLLRLIGAHRVDRARALVIRRDSLAVLMGRALIGMRVPVFFVAGTMGVPFRKFVFWDALGLLVTTPILLGLGAYLGEPIVDILTATLAKVGWLPFAMGCAVGVLFLMKRAQMKRAKESGAEDSS